MVDIKNMEIWKAESNKNEQTFMIYFCIVLGGIFMYLAYRSGLNVQNNVAGFGLGIILLFIGVLGLITGGQQTITIDPNTRQIKIQNIKKYGNSDQIIFFDEIEDIGIGYMGKKSNYVVFYYLILKLKNGKKYNLFAPGYFNNVTTRDAAETLKARMWKYIKGY